MQLLAAMTVALVLTACSSGGPAGTASSPPTATAATVTTSPATSAYVKMGQWVNSGAGTAYTAWATDLNQVAKAMGTNDQTTIAAACTKAGVDGTTLSSYLPSPDGQFTAHLAEAIRDTTDSATACASGDFATATPKLLAANAEVGAAATRLNQLKTGS